MNILIIGCGAIGSTLAEYAQDDSSIETIYLYDRFEAKMKHLTRLYKKCRGVPSISTCLDDVQLVVEAASIGAVKEYALMVIQHGKDIVIMSVGALADDELKEALEREAVLRNVRIIVPSGACGGLDALASAKYSEITQVKLTTIKPPKGLSDAPYVKDNKIDLFSFERPTVVFTGSAREAIKGFPANVNIAVTISLCGIGLDKTMVDIVCDPGAKRNTHILEVNGAFGEFRCEFSNLPSPENPRTSYIAALSAIKCLSRARSSGIIIV